MLNKPLVPLMLSVPEELRDELRRLAAKQNLEHPDKVTSAAEIARNLLIKKVTHFMEVKTNV